MLGQFTGATGGSIQSFPDSIRGDDGVKIGISLGTGYIRKTPVKFLSGYVPSNWENGLNLGNLFAVLRWQIDSTWPIQLTIDYGGFYYNRDFVQVSPHGGDLGLVVPVKVPSRISSWFKLVGVLNVGPSFLTAKWMTENENWNLGGQGLRVTSHFYLSFVPKGWLDVYVGFHHSFSYLYYRVVCKMLSQSMVRDVRSLGLIEQGSIGVKLWLLRYLNLSLWITAIRGYWCSGLQIEKIIKVVRSQYEQ